MGNLWSNGNAKRTFNIGFAAPKIWFKTWVKLIMQWLKISWIQLLKFMSEFTSNLWANSRKKFSKRPKTDYFTQHFKSLWIVFELKYSYCGIFCNENVTLKESCFTVLTSLYSLNVQWCFTTFFLPRIDIYLANS